MQRCCAVRHRVCMVRSSRCKAEPSAKVAARVPHHLLHNKPLQLPLIRALPRKPRRPAPPHACSCTLPAACSALAPQLPEYAHCPHPGGHPNHPRCCHRVGSTRPCMPSDACLCFTSPEAPCGDLPRPAAPHIVLAKDHTPMSFCCSSCPSLVALSPPPHMAVQRCSKPSRCPQRTAAALLPTPTRLPGPVTYSQNTLRCRSPSPPLPALPPPALIHTAVPTPTQGP